MASPKGKIFRLLSGFVLDDARVHTVQRIGSYQRVHLTCDVKAFAAGAKVQLPLPTDDTRTYTPIPAPDGMILLGHKHGVGPGSRWLGQVRTGDKLAFASPQRALGVGAGPVIVVGDETNVAVAAAFSLERSGQAHAVIQAYAATDVGQAAASVGLHQVDVVPRGETGATVSAITARLTSTPKAVVVLTGGSELVVAVRDALRRAGVRNIKTKTHWIPGKTGLD